MPVGAIVLYKKSPENPRRIHLEAQFLSMEEEKEILPAYLIDEIENGFEAIADEVGQSIIGTPMMVFSAIEDPLEKKGSSANRLSLVLSRALGDVTVNVIPTVQSMFWLSDE